MNVMNVSATILFREGTFVLKVASLEFPLTIVQFADIARASSAGSPPAAEVARCAHRNMYGAPCMKTPGHTNKHQYLKKKFAKLKAVKEKIDARRARSAKGLCSFCELKPVKGKKLCGKHLTIARASAEKARQTNHRRSRIAKKRAA